MTTSAPPQVPPMVRPRRRWWLRGVMGLAGLALLALSVPLYFHYATEWAWNAAEAEADRLDPRWRLLDIEEDRQPIPKEENSALILMAHLPPTLILAQNHPNYQKIFKDLPPSAQLNHQQLKLVRDVVTKHAKALTELRKLKDMPRGRFPITYRNAYDPWNDSPSRSVGLYCLLEHDAYCLAQDGQYDAAVESCQAIINIARSFGDQPGDHARGHRLELQVRAAITLERVLAQGEASEEVLRAIQDSIATELKDNMWLRHVRNMRAGGHFFHDNVRAGKVTGAEFQRQYGFLDEGPLDRWITENFPRTRLSGYPESLRYMNRLVEIARLPLHEQRAKIVELDATIGKFVEPRTDIFLRLFDHQCQSRGLMRSTQVALACERYRMRHVHWPESLDMLVREKLLDEVPIDPVDNKPLRYRVKPEGVVVYSIGYDRADNQGRIESQFFSDPLQDFDCGFRLWDVRWRRQAPLPPVVLPKEIGPSSP